MDQWNLMESHGMSWNVMSIMSQYVPIKIIKQIPWISIDFKYFNCLVLENSSDKQKLGSRLTQTNQLHHRDRHHDICEIFGEYQVVRVIFLKHPSSISPHLILLSMTSCGIFLNTIVAVLTWCPIFLRECSLQFFAASSPKPVFRSLPSYKQIRFKSLTYQAWVETRH